MRKYFYCILIACGFSLIQGCASTEAQAVSVNPHGVAIQQPITRGLDPQQQAQAIADAQLNAKVGIALANSGIDNVSIKSYQGIVQLSGAATSNAQSKRAEQIASGVTGVRYINNNLTVRTVKRSKVYPRYKTRIHK